MSAPRIRPLRDAITWSRGYRLASYARGSLWIVPFVAIVVEFVLSRFTQGLDARLGWTLLGLGVSGAQALYQTIITMTLSFMVFTFGSLLVAIQVASVQLTPRVIATTLLRNNIVRYTVGLFVFTLLYALRGLDRMESTVLQFNVFTAGLLGLACLVAFLFLIDYAARLLRPASIVWRVAQTGIEVLEAVHPQRLGDTGVERPPPPVYLGEPAAIIPHQGRSGTLLAVNQEALVHEAKATDTVIEVVPSVGDFIATDEPLFRIYGTGMSVREHRLHTAIAIGPERTMEQDPTFAFRILCDIALKALSKAINDPTTAVLAIDQIHRLLRVAGRRYLQHDLITDAQGRVLVVVRTPNWSDYVHLAFREIRLHGIEQIQVARRLRAVIDNLIVTLPKVRHPALLAELDLMDRTSERVYWFAEDLALARVSDSQGLGGVITPPGGEGTSPYGRMPDAA